MQELEQAISDPGSTSDGAGLLEKAESLARFVEDHGFADYSVKARRLAYEFAMRVGDPERARLWAERHLESHQLIDPNSIDTQRAQQLLDKVYKV